MHQNHLKQEKKNKPPGKRENVYALTDAGKRAVIESAKQKPDDDCNRLILKRLSRFLDLKNNTIKYHNSCQKSMRKVQARTLQLAQKRTKLRKSFNSLQITSRKVPKNVSFLFVKYSVSILIHILRKKR